MISFFRNGTGDSAVIRKTLLLFLSISISSLLTLPANSANLDDALAAIRKIGAQGEGHPEATAAWKTIAAASIVDLPTILAEMKPDNVLANNWLRSAVETIVQNEQKKGRQFDLAALNRFLADASNAPRGRELAFQLITESNPDAKRKLIAGFRNDPSLELRRLGVEQMLNEAKLQGEQQQVATLKTALTHARDTDQVKEITDSLAEMDVKVDLPRHFGFIMRWNLIAPFDNTDKSGFDKAYPPEDSIDLEASYFGKNDAKVSWISHRTSDDYGLVDLAKTLDKHKGAVAYAFARFDSQSERDAELRLGCINANKIWLNGQLLTANHVYHSGRGIDQYVGKGRLKKGANEILLKICQNEQTERWAQDWQFQLRVCDALGTAILSRERLAEQAN